ncbi:hypothetical protein JTE90_010849 [Oedothorax gibbosus]|uniref:Uncharacterized protein n=1 Tax=Oedothorax gibbosus TaxID=931172 RepID=A0AAV6V5Q7_9ARAC|nr:hypothetical protein JTE90_010849 [Oedothorax gibbosus]
MHTSRYISSGFCKTRMRQSIVKPWQRLRVDNNESLSPLTERKSSNKPVSRILLLRMTLCISPPFHLQKELLQAVRVLFPLQVLK